MGIKTDLFFQIGSLRSFKYFFTHEEVKYEEVIYCVILEHVEFIGSDLYNVRVGQISNLEEYLKNTKTDTFERVFKVNELQPNPEFML
jgi:hypothetical protein